MDDIIDVTGSHKSVSIENLRPLPTLPRLSHPVAHWVTWPVSKALVLSPEQSSKFPPTSPARGPKLLLVCGKRGILTRFLLSPEITVDP